MNQPYLNQEIIKFLKNSRSKNNDVLFNAMLKLYLEKAPELVDEIEELAATGEVIDLRRSLHELASISSSIGAIHILSLTESIREMVKDEIPGWKEKIPQIRPSLNDTFEALKELI